MVIRRVGFAALFLLLGPTVSGAPAPAAAPRPAKERRLHVASAEASSYLVNDWNKFQENYLPLYVGDDDPRTSWNLKTEGIGEWLRVNVTPMEGATKLRMKIRNGYQKTPRLWEANSRAKELTVVLLPSNKTADVTLTDTSDWQEIGVEQPAGPFTAVELRVKSVYPGKKYDDLCISDVQLFVTATSSDNPAFEKQHLAKLADWKKDRVAAAKMFKTKLGRSLPVAPQYLVSDLEVAKLPGDAKTMECPGGAVPCYMSRALVRASSLPDNGKHAGALSMALELTKTKFAAMTPVRVAVRDHRPLPAVDGLCTPSLDSCQEDPCERALSLALTGQLAYLNTGALALVEQTGLPPFGDAVGGKLPQCNRAEPTTFAWASRDPAATSVDGGAAALRALLLVRCGLVQGREGPFPASRPQLLVYDAEGRLELSVNFEQTAIIDWDQGSAGPKISRASIVGSDRPYDLQVEAVAGSLASK